MPTAQDLVVRWPALDVAGRRARLHGRFQWTSGRLADAVAPLAAKAVRAGTGVWNRDPSTWGRDADVQLSVSKRLGWLDSPALMADSLERLSAFAQGIRQDGFTDVVLLGMGGSSLAPEVLRAVVGTSPGWLRLHMLDSTDPAAVLAVQTPIDRTLYLFASKSGTTVEPNSLAAFFRQELERGGVDDWARHFVAITDEGTELAHRARAEHFRELFINPSDIGGRYSALSFFGLVPSALMGQDVAALIGWGLGMLAASEPGAGPADSPDAATLGLAMAAGSRSGCDKLTLLVPPALEAFGLWVEQLVAESTGKSGVGVIPIVGETPAPAASYGTDRVFVRMRLAGAPGPDHDALVAGLRQLGAPVADIEMPDPTALGAEFLRWEIATAVAGALLEINPFDEPNVSQAKEATRALLAQYRVDGQVPAPQPDATADGVSLTLSAAAREALAGTGRAAPHGPGIDAAKILSLIGRGDYFALLAYLGPDPQLAGSLHAFRMGVRDGARAATMFGYGPRYLHSTGQLHKGGPNTGVFVLVSARPRTDLPIPGEAFSFATLELAQALGDFQSLDTTGRRALHVHLPEPDVRLLESVTQALLGHLARIGG